MLSRQYRTGRKTRRRFKSNPYKPLQTLKIGDIEAKSQARTNSARSLTGQANRTRQKGKQNHFKSPQKRTLPNGLAE